VLGFVWEEMGRIRGGGGGRVGKGRGVGLKGTGGSKTGGRGETR
jgi:hypothetical protein